MNSKLLYAATIAIALLGTGAAMASEATQFDNTPSTLTRAEVKAELKRAQVAGELDVVTYTYGDFDGVQASTRSRADVRAEGRAEARNRRASSLYTGS